MATIIDALSSAVGAANVLTRPEDLVPYSFDGTAALKERPGAVVFPITTAQVAECVRLAASSRMPIVTRGSGTGLSGGSVPVPGCLVLCLTKMDAILEVDPRNLLLRAQPGAITQRIDEAAAAHGLFYPPDPGIAAHQHDRRQRRREFGRPARSQVRRDARLRHGPRGRARERPGRAPRQRRASRTSPGTR